VGVKAVRAGGLILLLLLVGLSLAVWWITRRVEGHYFYAGKVRLHFTDEGVGEPVILLHGFAVNADLNWRLPGLTESLAQEFRVVSLDLRGHGLSAKPHDPESYGLAMTDDVVALLDHLGIEKAHVVGYSLGGIITLKLATTQADRMWTASPLGAGWEKPGDSVFLAAVGGIAEALEAGRGVPPLAGSLGGTRERPGFLHTAWVRVVTRYLNDGRALAAMVRALPALTVQEEELRGIGVPVCSIVGTADPMKPGVDAMLGKVPDHTVFYIEGADHLQATRSPLLERHLREFLSAHSASQVNRTRADPIRLAGPADAS
jgi:pimeloyl-ACP methyl ester carboxylesterase